MGLMKTVNLSESGNEEILIYVLAEIPIFPPRLSLCKMRNLAILFTTVTSVIHRHAEPFQYLAVYSAVLNT